MADGYPRQVWVNKAGDELIESYTITNMAHGTPLATGKADDECGVAGPFLLEVGISSSYHIAKFFGLTADCRRVASPRSEIAVAAKQLHADWPALKPPQPHVLEGEILPPESEEGPERTHNPPPLPIDVGAVITTALKAAGLMKG
jgi:feruloyl esterase